MNIKAIETTYRGYRFRSRLEARYAVFFDALGVRFEYEMEGFELTSGWYLPDFWLPDFKLWFEIKPPDGECYHAETMQKAGKAIIVANGSPMQNDLRLLCYYYNWSSGGEGIFNCQFAINRSGHVVISVPGERSDCDFCVDDICSNTLPMVTPERFPSSMILLRAAQQARSARFDKTDNIMLPKE